MDSHFNIHSSINQFNPLNVQQSSNIKGKNLPPENSIGINSKIIACFDQLNEAHIRESNDSTFFESRDVTLPFQASIADKVKDCTKDIFSNKTDEDDNSTDEFSEGFADDFGDEPIDDQLNQIINEKDNGLIATKKGELSAKAADTKEKINIEEKTTTIEEKTETAVQITAAREFKFEAHAKEKINELTKDLEVLLNDSGITVEDAKGRSLNQVLHDEFENILQNTKSDEDTTKLLQECVKRLSENGTLVKKTPDGKSRPLTAAEVESLTHHVEVLFKGFLIDQFQIWTKQEEAKNRPENRSKTELNSSYKTLEKYTNNKEPLSAEGKKILDKLLNTKLYKNALAFGDIIQNLIEANRKDREMQAEIRAIEKKFQILKNEINRWELQTEFKKTEALNLDKLKIDLKGKTWRPVGELIGLHKSTVPVTA